MEFIGFLKDFVYSCGDLTKWLFEGVNIMGTSIRPIYILSASVLPILLGIYIFRRFTFQEV